MAAVATRSSGACLIWSKGNSARYARFARRYRAVTNPVPIARESGTVRRGFFTSPAVKVTLFQASEENKDPTWATQKAMNKPNAPPAAVTAGTKEKSGVMVEAPRGTQISVKLAF